MQPNEQQQPEQLPQTPPVQPQQHTPYEQQSAPSPGPIVTVSPDPVQATEPVGYQTAASAPLPENTSEQPADPGFVEPIHWQATEYVHREKDQMWFILFGIIALVLIAIAIFIIKSPTFAILIPVMAAALLVYTRHPPRLIDYTLSRQGLHINDQLYGFAEFKSFSLLPATDQYTIMLIPTKRFKPAVSINFPEEVGEAIVDMLAARLPMREMEPDVFDRLIRRLRL